MTTITDEYMRQRLATIKDYCIALLKRGPNRNRPDVEKLVWEHGRRNFALQADGLLSIVMPVTDDGDVRGLYIFNVGPEQVREIMDGDPAVQAGVFAYEVHPCVGFPGNCLPGEVGR